MFRSCYFIAFLPCFSFLGYFCFSSLLVLFLFVSFLLIVLLWLTDFSLPSYLYKFTRVKILLHVLFHQSLMVIIIHSWTRSMETVMNAKNKLKFVDGSLDETDKSDFSFSTWRQCNNTIVSWIVHFVSSHSTQCSLNG